MENQIVSDTAALNIRFATVEDIPRLHHLYRQLVPEKNPSEDDMRATLLHILEHLESVSIIVAELGDTLVATCQIIVYDNLIRSPQKKAVLDSVVVDEPFRNRGIGTRMIRWAVSELEQRECAIIYVSFADNRDVAPKLYKKAGFEPFGTTFYIHKND